MSNVQIVLDVLNRGKDVILPDQNVYAQVRGYFCRIIDNKETTLYVQVDPEDTEFASLCEQLSKNSLRKLKEMANG
jgi:hypothetical protein